MTHGAVTILVRRKPEVFRRSPGAFFHALLGIAWCRAARRRWNEVMEYKVDGHMRRTAQRPLPTAA